MIISGESVTGKSTIAQRFTEEFSLPLISRDEIKERLFNQLGVKDRDWSHQVGLAAYEIMYYIADHLLSVGQSVILESTFKPARQRQQEISKLITKYQPQILHIQTTASAPLLVERFAARSNSVGRHPGHVDSTNLEDFKVVVEQGYQPMQLPGTFLKLNTDDWSMIDYPKIFEMISSSSQT